MTGLGAYTISKKVDNPYPDEFAHQLRIPPTPNSPAAITGKSQKWKLAFGFVLLPFLLLGFPTHLLIFSNSPSKPKVIKSPQNKLKWLEEILFPDKISSLILTLITISITTYFLIYFATSIWNVIDCLVIQGELSFELLRNFLIFFRTLPAILPLIIFWIIGYKHRDVIASFDAFRNGVIKRLKLRPRGKADFNHPASKPVFWVKLGLIYFIILCVHVIPIISDGWRRQHWTSIWIGLMYRFIPPLYCTCCWVLASEFQLMTGYLTAVLKDENGALTTRTIVEIKELYKKSTNHITYVNKKIGKYLSWWIFPVLSLSTAFHFLAMVLLLLGNVTLRTAMLFFGLIGEIDDEEMVNDTAEEWIRSGVAHAFVGFLEIGMIVLMIRFAIGVNDESRFAHVLINEVIGDHSLPVIKDEELYHVTRHLKFYMYMTNEQDSPSLMMLPSIARLPIIGYRLHSSKLRNPPLHRRFLNEIV